MLPHSRPGSIVVESTRQDQEVHLHVWDSGYGVAPDRLAALNNGVGLANTRARLEHLYPGAHRLDFANTADGFRVSVSIPFRPSLAEVEPVAAEVA